MIYLFAGGFALLALLWAAQHMRKIDRRQWRRGLRWGAGSGLALVTVALAFARRIDIAVFTGAAAFSVLRSGRLGPFSFDGPAPDGGNISKVKSRYFAMALDHDTGTVEGRVLDGQFAGVDLISLGEAETRALLDEVAWDPDSMSLLESWLDANRSGWREYFAQGSDEAQATPSGADPMSEAYEVLGLKPGASEDEIRTAHRELMKGVHPDHGGSSYLASKINEARDRLLKR